MDRDRTLGETFYLLFTTRRFSTGVPFTLAGTPGVSAIEDNSGTPITAGITLGVDHASVTGLNLLTIVATGGNGFEAGKDYSLYIDAGTVDSVSVIGEVIGSFSLGLAASFTRLGAPAGASVSADVAAVKVDTAATLVDTAAMQPFLDIIFNAFVLTSATIETVTSQTQLVIPATADATDDEAYHGALAVLIDGTDPNQKSIRIIEAYSASTRTVTLSKAPDFTVTTSDTITILATTDAGGVWDMLLTGAKHNIATSAGRRLRSIDAAFEVHSGTAQSGTAGSITLDTGASSDDDIYQGDRIVIIGGTGAQEHGICIAYNGTTKVATMAENWIVTPDSTSEFEVVPAAVDVKTWLHNLVTASGNGLPDVNVNEVADASQTAGDLAALINALNNLSAAQVATEISDAWSVDTVALPGQVAPPLTPTRDQRAGHLYKAYRNRKTQTATQWSLLADNESTVDQKATVSDDTTTAIKQEIVSGP